jgi:hypothetical protein
MIEHAARMAACYLFCLPLFCSWGQKPPTSKDCKGPAIIERGLACRETQS